MSMSLLEVLSQRATLKTACKNTEVQFDRRDFCQTINIDCSKYIWKHTH